ncbi:MAG: MFS transporter [Eubacterium sp.]|nr:MFS transporter [Eubacterium sp.]
MKDKNRILIGCIIYYAVSMGMVGMANASYGLLPGTFHVSVSALGFITMICPLVFMTSSALFAWADRLIGLKGMCFLGVGVVLGMGVSIGLLKSMAAILLMYILQGVIVGATSVVLTSTIVSRCFREGVERKLSLVLGAGILGSALCQWISGPLFETVGFQKGYFMACAAASMILLLAAVFLIRIPRKAEFPDTGRERAESTAGKQLYKNSIFRFCALGRIFGNAGVGYTILYATLHFTKTGMSYPTATMILSMMTLASGFLSFFNGRMIEKMTLQRFVMLVFGAAAVCHILMAGYSGAQFPAVIVLIILSYAFGAPTGNISVLSVNQLFPAPEITEANAKLYAFGGLGCMGFNPLCGTVADHFGYRKLFLMLAAFTLLSLLCYLAAIRVHRTGKEKR